MNWFKNLRIKSKLLISFSIVIVFAIIMAGFAVITVNRLDESYTYILEYPQQRLEYLMQVDASCTTMRQATTALVLNVADSGRVNDYWSQFEHEYSLAIENIDSYLENNDADTVRDAAVLSTNNEIVSNVKSLLESYRENAERGMQTAVATGDMTETNAIFFNGASIISEATGIIEDLLPKAGVYIDEVSAANTREKNSAVLLFVILVAVIVIISVVIAFYNAGLIASPLGFLSRALEQFGFRGDTELPPEAAQSAMECVKRKDEIGVCARAFGAMLEHIQNIEQTLGMVADGDLTADIKALSEKDSMGIALSKMISSLNTMFTEIRIASDQVSLGAGQVSQGAQQLASGSSQQAASIEEFSSFLAELQKKTNRNAENSIRAKDANSETGKRLENSIRSMGDMLNAMKEIDESSGNITKVIKVIDDIAFQTNILALNAAVEAARAGQHGKGFAVVADEVRSLASKSAEAAKETAALIEGSSARVKEGNQIVAKTNADLEAAAQNARESILLIEEVTAASNEQAKSIHDINQGIEQISTVVQANSATAQESAATSQQMSAQSTMLNEIVARFKLSGTAASHFRQLEPPAADDSFAITGGKY